MKKIIGKLLPLFVLSVLLTGCVGQTTADFGVGKIVSQNHRVSGDKVAANLRLRHQFPNKFYVEYTHSSLLTSGVPFNSRDDMFVDQIGIGYQLILRDTEKN